MEKEIIVKGIQTNNLKNIDVVLKKRGINLILGSSGSGKSSLAYDTIAQIGLHELGAMYSDVVKEPDYKVEYYSNMIVTIPIKQLNFNNNVRSTIGTCFSLNPCLAKVFSSLLDLPYDYFVLNKTENVCPKCFGVGHMKTLDSNKIIDYDRTLEEVPIRCWKRNVDFYKKIIKLYCDEIGVDSSKKFRQLSDSQRKQILYGISKLKYKIKYKVANCDSTKTTYYYGPMLNVPMLKNFAPSDEFYSEIDCDLCNGEKYENGHRTHKVCGFSIGEIMMMPFSDIPSWIRKVRDNYDCESIDFSLNQIESFAKKATELNLGYLFFNRSIPSLSGGELQRLRLVQVFLSQLSDLLIVLDEPLAGLSTKEKKVVYHNVIDLSKKHTLLIVDHHDVFLNAASQIYVLGEGGGRKGGKIIDTEEYIKKQHIRYQLDVLPIKNLRHITLKTEVYAYKGVDLNIALNRLNIIFGESGVGKSTLLREYFPQEFDDYLYINQKPMVGNVRSTVATNLNIATRIIQDFATEFRKDKSFFSNMASGEGSCKTCGGTGQIVYGSELQSQIVLECKDCRGTGFDKKLHKFKWHGKCIQDVWKMTIDEAIDYFEAIDKKITDKLRLAQNLLLGHLELGEKTSKLSGGENVRMKLIKALDANADVLGIDEPFKGLNSQEIFAIVKSLEELVHNGKTIIVVDHEEGSFQYFSNRIELVNKEGVLCAKIP